MKDQQFVCARIIEGGVDMSIDLKTLRFVVENHPDFWDGSSGVSVPTIKINNFQELVKEIVRSINAEAEDGSTLLTRMIDRAIFNAVNSGCEGVDYE